MKIREYVHEVSSPKSRMFRESIDSADSYKIHPQMKVKVVDSAAKSPNE